MKWFGNRKNVLDAGNGFCSRCVAAAKKYPLPVDPSTTRLRDVEIEQLAKGVIEAVLQKTINDPAGVTLVSETVVNLSDENTLAVANVLCELRSQYRQGVYDAERLVCVQHTIRVHDPSHRHPVSMKHRQMETLGRSIPCVCCGTTFSIGTAGSLTAPPGYLDGLCPKCYANPAWRARLKGPEYPVPPKCKCPRVEPCPVWP